jgi:hypothetical protein
MKRIIAFVLLPMAINVYGQTFEGTVKWSMKMEMDPQMKMMMEQGMQQLKDPAMQAKMKEMMDKMNDPKTKKMMEENPQMKAQMEGVLKMIQAGNSPTMASLMPTAFLFKVKGGNTVTLLEGGMMPMEILYFKDQDKTVRLDRKNKTFTVVANNTSKTNQPTVKVTKTNEKMKVLNYNCVKYVAAVTENDETVNQIFWTTTDIKDFDMKSLTKQRMNQGGQQLFYNGIEGVPLKIEMSVQDVKMIMVVEEIKRQALSDAEFAVPADFKDTKQAVSGN